MHIYIYRYVKSVSPDGAAKLSNQVFNEDCLISVDGQNVHTKPVTQVCHSEHCNV